MGQPHKPCPPLLFGLLMDAMPCMLRAWAGGFLLRPISQPHIGAPLAAHVGIINTVNTIPMDSISASCIILDCTTIAIILIITATTCLDCAAATLAVHVH